MRTLSRIAAIALAAALLVGATAMLADYRADPHPVSPYEVRRRCRSDPEPGRLPNFIGQFVLMGGIALAGRKVLRLRLVDSRLP